MFGRGALALLAVLFSSLPVKAQDDDEDFPAKELVHSDLPLYDVSYENLWPQHFSDDDGSFGCTSRVAFGVWQFTDPDGELESWELSNYGVFHCGLLFREWHDEEDRKTAPYKSGFAAMLGTSKQDGKTLELWAFQRGNIPGSDYILLSREPGSGIVKAFTVLQRSCAPSQMRRLPAGASMDTWLTDYCVINTRDGLLALAKRMLQKPPLGQLKWIDPPAAI